MLLNNAMTCLPNKELEYYSNAFHYMMRGLPSWTQQKIVTITKKKKDESLKTDKELKPTTYNYDLLKLLNQNRDACESLLRNIPLNLSKGQKISLTFLCHPRHQQSHEGLGSCD